jgi:hypothetical protein
VDADQEVTMKQAIVTRPSMTRWSLPVLLILFVSIPAGAAVKELRNDSFTGAGAVTCQVGFIEGESGAVKLTADPGDYPYRIEKVRMLVCPGASTGYVIMRISEDNTGTVLPGPMLYEEIVQITGSDDSLNELDLSTSNIIVTSGSVRVELEWLQDSPPGLANDLDGYVPNVNYIYAIPGGWFYANQLLVLGDWIIRMEIETGVDTPIFVDGFESGGTTFWSSQTP